MRRILIAAALALGTLGCATGTLLDADANTYPPRGDELCLYHTFVINPASEIDTTSREDILATFSGEISKLGFTVASRSDADLLIDVNVSDRTACVHCQEDHNYWRWFVVLSEARSNKFIIQLSGYGSKVVTRPARVTSKQLARLRHCGGT